jgi:hypothetical protein
MKKVKHSQLEPINIIVGISLGILTTLHLMTTVVRNLPGGGQEKDWMTPEYHKCDEHYYNAYTLPRSQYIVLCPQQVDYHDDIVGDEKDHTYSTGVVYIDEVKAATSTVILHEFLHLLFNHISEFSF